MRLVLKLTAAAVALMLFTWIVFYSVVFLTSYTASACTPTASAVLANQVRLGSGKEATAYFAQFGAQVVAQKKANAALIIQIGRQEGFTDYQIELAIGVALQESGLMNLKGGDRDSLGLFQQRPSAKTWGTAEQIMDPTHATKAFFAALKRVSNSDLKNLPMVDVAIKVQNPNILDYHRGWAQNHWEFVAKELVGTTSETGTCAGTSDIAHLPLDPGYSVTATYNDTDANYAGVKPHSGIDLSDYKNGATLGRPVYAAMDGVVVASGIGNSCSTNNAVLIKHADGAETEYMHMSGADITVHVGDRVKTGQQIGKIGNCGDSTGAHLHFAVELAQGKAPWMASLLHINQFGVTWIDPVGYLAHYGVTLVPKQ